MTMEKFKRELEKELEKTMKDVEKDKKECITIATKYIEKGLWTEAIRNIIRAAADESKLYLLLYLKEKIHKQKQKQEKQ